MANTFTERDLGIIQNLAGLPDSMVTDNPSDIITRALPYVFGIAGIILLINITMSGISMMTSKGDPKALQSAQGKLTTSLIGIVVLFSSFWIVQLIFKFLGINIVLFN